ncbi:trifunctional transcriptional regulator/proline dehydrogenase/L-glutamate gamma-semialdehyde dehydrogenase [Sphingomonas phyllosphaerae]|uniref:trifunctional transcriptional regulator/proline dehydrogenase/L-glutamate gamma-semialdehyde dehydrogenase n=1 Tax=Sphingomonas phyllosphaerae TaxID=257003 RepID=UPI000413950A|nr:trifunctional transcriptional regulator/proline dehydrogenase/L-glutamate gamma-semialdehyde dehydrogenase [Sphingomonas phyllosphaerae]
MRAALPPFADFAPPIRLQGALRQAITAAYRRSEPECLAPLLDAATLPDDVRIATAATATALVTALRAKHKGTGVEGLVQEYALSSQEGVALMCLAEALLRIPDTATRDALIRDKISGGDWRAHVGDGRSLFVNAATWGLVVTGKLTGSVNDSGLNAALTRLIARAGEPVIRRGVDMAMRMMGEQFVTGETIAEALKRSRPLEARGFRYSYDMLGEAATTAADADRYYRDYEEAVTAIGVASAGRGIYEGPGISIKLSALHPRYVRAQAARVMDELLPRVKALAVLAKSYDIGLNIDAEEADRLELSLDLLESLATDPDLAGWNGLGFVVQAYGKRCPFVIDWIVDLARKAGRRIMVRLVKGAYWDAEIKRAQVDGLPDFPVYTRKVHTDVAYTACARKLLAARDAVFPQFATHNAQTLSAIYQLAGPDFTVGDYEFQCLHGMGEPLYDEVVGAAKLNRPCRIYAPVGTHETLLAYLVRRLLENGANSSFVNRIADPDVAIADLVADPVETVRRMASPGQKNPQIALPRELYGARLNSAGLDLSDETVLASLSGALAAEGPWQAGEIGAERAVLNPADHREQVGTVREMSVGQAQDAARAAAAAATAWAARSPVERAAMLDRAADAMQGRMPQLLALIVREAGKSLPNAIAEVREAIDFLRYYAQQARSTLGTAHRSLGVVTCISPWNFPLAIFTGQVAAALVAGNAVLAKPAEETPLIAAQGVAILHEAGVPRDVLQLIPGDGAIGAALVAAPETMAVMFTGSTEVARLIQRELAKRLLPDGAPIPFIAETGGQNAMIVDSSALAEQVVADVITSAFDSAGQRCSALRILCLQEEVADRTLTMIRGALHELSIGRTDRLAVDIGPVISAEAQATIEQHIAKLRAAGHRVEQVALSGDTSNGTFVAPTIIELNDIAELEREVFGPVLHVVRFRRADLDRLIDRINATGYGLTFGLHTRLDETIAHVTSRVKAGNLYINRNVIGAVVGVQPFGGRGLSGTGPKAGGPLYLGRLVSGAELPPPVVSDHADPAARDLAMWLEELGEASAAARVRDAIAASMLGADVELAGPVGERNLYALHPRGRVLVLPQTRAGLLEQLGVALAAGNDVVVGNADVAGETLSVLPASVAARVRVAADWQREPAFAGALIEGNAADVSAALGWLAQLPGPIVLPQAASAGYRLDWLVEEVSTSINTTAAGGNASLMSLN